MLAPARWNAHFVDESNKLITLHAARAQPFIRAALRPGNAATRFANIKDPTPAKSKAITGTVGSGTALPGTTDAILDYESARAKAVTPLTRFVPVPLFELSSLLYMCPSLWQVHQKVRNDQLSGTNAGTNEATRSLSDKPFASRREMIIAPSIAYRWGYALRAESDIRMPHTTPNEEEWTACSDLSTAHFVMCPNADFFRH